VSSPCHHACPLVSSSKTKPCQSSSVRSTSFFISRTLRWIETPLYSDTTLTSAIPRVLVSPAESFRNTIVKQLDKIHYTWSTRSSWLDELLYISWTSQLDGCQMIALCRLCFMQASCLHDVCSTFARCLLDVCSIV